MLTDTPVHRRRKGTARAEARPFRFTDRDGDILRALVKMRFMTTGQLADLAFEGSRWAAKKRLRKLLDHGAVRVWVRSLAEENLYSLTRAGASQGLEPGEQAGETVFVPGALDGNLDHLLAINAVRVSLATSLHAAEGELVSWRSDWELRAGVRGASVPDALFSIEIGGTRKQFALEVEHAGKSPRKFLVKILRYRSLSTRLATLYGVDDLGVLVVGCDDRSVERARQALRSMPQLLRVWFTSLNDIRDRGALAPIWQPVHGHERHSLRDL